MGFRHLISILTRLSAQLSDLERPIRQISSQSLAGSRLAVDTNLYLHLCRGRQSVQHIVDLFINWARHLISIDIEPIFIFDGPDRCSAMSPPKLTRMNRINDVIGPVLRCDQWRQNRIDMFRPSSLPNSGLWSMVKRALDNEGVAWITATNDADSFCALLAHPSVQVVDAVVSEDSDLIAWGAPIIVRGLLHAFQHDRPSANQIDLKSVRRALGDLSQEQLIQFCFALHEASISDGERHPCMSIEQALRLASDIKSDLYVPSATESAAVTRLLGWRQYHDPIMLHPGHDHPPTTLLQWAEFYRVKRAYSQIDRTSTNRRSRHRPTR